MPLGSLHRPRSGFPLRSRSRARRRLVGRLRSRLLVLALAGLLDSTATAQVESDRVDGAGLPSEDEDWRRSLERLGIAIDLSYTGDLIANTRGGNARKRTYLGAVDATLAWDMAALFERDLGVLFVYGLWNHGGRPSTFVGDVQATDNIDAPDSVRLFEAWWQRTLLDERMSLLVGLYDVNSEFYAIDSAELFLNGSFGMGGELGNTGRSGPATFPVAGWGARFKAEPARGFELQIAVVEGAPGDPRRPTATSLDFDDGEGAFVIAEIAHHRFTSTADDEEDDITRPLQRRRLGRTWAERPKWLRVSLGTWLYTAKQAHVSRIDGLGEPIESRGHPGLYLIADYEADHLWRDRDTSMSLFVQLGFSDGHVGQF